MVKRSKRIRGIIKRRNLSDDDLLEQSREWILNFKNAQHKPTRIIDGASHKTRTIIVPTVEELIVQHCVVNALKPMFLCGMYYHSYASIPGRGAHKGKKYVERWIRNSPKDTKYVLKMDIRHFFDSISHDVLKSMLIKQIHDDEMLRLLFEIIDVTSYGLPLGFYTSQWLSNWYLQGLDHYIKEILGAKYYMRYMDDMVIFGSSKKFLRALRRNISEYVSHHLRLRLKGNWQIFRLSCRDLDFMGFRFYRHKTTLRRSIMLKASRKAARLSKKRWPSVYDARQMLSYLGYIDATDTYNMYLRWIKPYISFRDLRQKISKADRASPTNVYRRIVKMYT